MKKKNFPSAQRILTPTSKLLHNCQGGRQIFLKNCRAYLFNDDLSKEPNFGRIHLAGQYLNLDQ